MATNVIHITEANPQQSAARTQYRRIADFLKQLTPVQRSRMVGLDIEPWSVERILRVFGHLNPQQWQFLNRLECEVVPSRDLMDDFDFGSTDEFDEFLAGLDEALIEAGVHPSEVYRVEYSLAEEEIEAHYELVFRFEEDGLLPPFEAYATPALVLADAFLHYCNFWSGFGGKGLHTLDLLDMMHRFRKSVESVLWKVEFYPTVPLAHQRENFTVGLPTVLVPMLEAAARPEFPKFKVPHVLINDFMEELKDEHVFKALFVREAKPRETPLSVVC